jgi:iron complex transport system permease protein
MVSLCILVVAFLLHFGVGTSAWYDPRDIVAHLFRGHTGESGLNDILWTFRLPRAVQCVLTGAILGLSGVTFQSVFRNPLAEPYIVGASSGAAIGGATVSVFGFGNMLYGFAQPVAGFVTGILSLVMVLALATRRGAVEAPTLLLAGVVISTMLSAILSVIILASGQNSNVILRWLLGSESEAFWSNITLLTIGFIVGFTVLLRYSRQLNALSVGDEIATSVGVDIVRVRNVALLTVTGLVALAVSTVGIIGFVGLVAPHVARRLVGADLRKTMPLSALLGAILLLLADTVAQRGIHGIELPVGVVTALIGAPSLLIILRKRP